MIATALDARLDILQVPRPIVDLSAVTVLTQNHLTTSIDIPLGESDYLFNAGHSKDVAKTEIFSLKDIFEVNGNPDHDRSTRVGKVNMVALARSEKFKNNKDLQREILELMYQEAMQTSTEEMLQGFEATGVTRDNAKLEIEEQQGVGYVDKALNRDRHQAEVTLRFLKECRVLGLRLEDFRTKINDDPEINISRSLLLEDHANVILGRKQPNGELIRMRHALKDLTSKQA